MEKDLKMLEELMEFLKRNDFEDFYGDATEEIQALENLIKRCKELEEKLIKYDKTLENLQKETIWKSKIEEKIKELEREFDFYAGREHFEWQDGEFDGEVCDDIALKIGVLKELLESEENK